MALGSVSIAARVDGVIAASKQQRTILSTQRLKAVVVNVFIEVATIHKRQVKIVNTVETRKTLTK